MKPLKTKVSVTLDADIIEQLKILAEADDRFWKNLWHKINWEIHKPDESQKTAHFHAPKNVAEQMRKETVLVFQKRLVETVWNKKITQTLIL